MKYLMDSNTYIQAKNTYYDISFCPAFWQWLELQHAQNKVSSIINVYDELTSMNDELSSWCKARKQIFLENYDEQTQDKYTEIIEYVYNLPNKNQNNVDGFLAKADPWLIAKASVIGATIVTHEKLDPPNSKKVKIPNV